MRATGSSFITPSTFLQISDHVSCCFLSNQDLSLPGAGHQDLGVHDQQSDQYDQLLWADFSHSLHHPQIWVKVGKITEKPIGEYWWGGKWEKRYFKVLNTAFSGPWMVWSKLNHRFSNTFIPLSMRTSLDAIVFSLKLKFKTC